MRTLLIAGLSLSGMLAAEKNVLEGSKWELDEAPSGVPVTIQKRRPTLAFERSRFSLKVCNSIGGPIKIEESRIVLTGPSMGTLMSCGEGDNLERALTAVVNKNQSFAVNNDRLTLIGSSGERFVFRRLATPSASAATKFIYVAPALVDCTGVARMKCLQVRASKDEPWKLHYEQIIGFEHVPGIEYRLRIKEDKVANPPADASSIRWFLDMVVEQTVVDRKAAEAYEASKRKP